MKTCKFLFILLFMGLIFSCENEEISYPIELVSGSVEHDGVLTYTNDGLITTPQAIADSVFKFVGEFTVYDKIIIQSPDSAKIVFKETDNCNQDCVDSFNKLFPSSPINYSGDTIIFGTMPYAVRAFGNIQNRIEIPGFVYTHADYESQMVTTTTVAMLGFYNFNEMINNLNTDDTLSFINFRLIYAER